MGILFAIVDTLFIATELVVAIFLLYSLYIRGKSCYIKKFGITSHAVVMMYVKQSNRFK